jgi:DNA topoisomerase-3
VKCRKPYKRLWISSLTDESIELGLKKLLDGREKEGMFQAGDVRNKADWLIGINLSRLYSIYHNARISVGRVQTPTLNMIVHRDTEIATFKKSKYFVLGLDNGAVYVSDNEDEKIIDRQKAEQLSQECSGVFAVISAETKEKQEQRPFLFSLTSLQKQANDKLGFSAQQTLDALQKLYEKKLTTYPRTDSDHLTEDMKSQVADTVQTLEFYDDKRVKSLLAQGLNLDKRVIDNAKVSDHHAVIPTKDVKKYPSMSLTDDETAVLKLVIERFLTALDKPYIYIETTYFFQKGQNKFKLTGRVPVSLGYRKFSTPEKPEKDDNKDENKKIPHYEKGQEITAKCACTEKETTPPKPFTESSLLSAMENISRKIDDKSKAEFVKERGLGTPATRAGIFEELVKNGLVERKSKNILSTEQGRKIISLLPDRVKSVELTADMEEKLADIECGKATSNAVLTEFVKYISTQIATEKEQKHEDLNGAGLPNNGATNAKNALGKCPECGADIIEGEKNYYCTGYKSGCKFTLWKNDKFWENKGKKLTATIVKTILAKGKIKQTFHSEKSGKDYDCFVKVVKKDVGGRVYFNFEMEFEKGK